jgi:hypothetical protein
MTSSGIWFPICETAPSPPDCQMPLIFIKISDPELLKNFKKLPLRNNIESKDVNSKYSD